MRVLGMISGTSHDGVDVAVVDFAADGTLLRGSLVTSGTTPYPDALRARLVAALPPTALQMAEVCALDTELGQFFASCASDTIADCGAVDLVCTHGQTVFHWVEEGHARGTLQLGQPAFLVEATGATVVSDVRSRDIAAGGQGAPLVPVLDLLLLGATGRRCGALNLGGIANMTVIPRPGDDAAPDEVTAYDLGPANALIDAAALQLTGRHFDADGALGAAGTVDAALLRHLMAEPYYTLPAPKSTGKELFHDGYLADLLQAFPDVRGPDLVATLTALTAEVVAAEVIRCQLQLLVVSGGGVRNPTLMAMIRDRLPEVEITTSDAFGAPSDAKEAIAFALIGYLTAHGLPGNVPSCTGADGPRVLGSITPTGRWEMLSAPMPTSLTLAPTPH